MHYELYISPSALKELKKLDSNEKESIKTKLKLLALDPFNTSIGITQMKGKHQPIYYRIKSGDYRAIYHIEDKGIYVDKIGHRKNIKIFTGGFKHGDAGILYGMGGELPF